MPLFYVNMKRIERWFKEKQELITEKVFIFLRYIWNFFLLYWTKLQTYSIINMDKSLVKETTCISNTTNHTETESLEESIEEMILREREKSQKSLSIIFSIIMMLISGYTIRRHTKHWRRYAAGIGSAIYLLIKVSGSGARRDWFFILVLWRHFSLSLPKKRGFFTFIKVSDGRKSLLNKFRDYTLVNLREINDIWMFS